MTEYFNINLMCLFIFFCRHSTDDHVVESAEESEINSAKYAAQHSSSNMQVTIYHLKFVFMNVIMFVLSPDFYRNWARLISYYTPRKFMKIQMQSHHLFQCL